MGFYDHYILPRFLNAAMGACSKWGLGRDTICHSTMPPR
jgi:hypothetical protein